MGNPIPPLNQESSNSGTPQRSSSWDFQKVPTKLIICGLRPHPKTSHIYSALFYIFNTIKSVLYKKNYTKKKLLIFLSEFLSDLSEIVKKKHFLEQ